MTLRALKVANLSLVLDTFTHTLGDFETIQSTLKTQHPVVPIFSMEKQTIVDPAYNKTAPDHMLVQGVLTSGAVAAISFRKAKKPVDDLSIRWLITGTEGEIEVTVPEGHFQMGPDGSTLRLRVGKEGEVQDVSFKEAAVPEHIQKAPVVGRNTARVYEAFGQDQEKYADFESALKTHKLLDQIARDAKYI
jgi:predicted dehydrogenase